MGPACARPAAAGPAAGGGSPDWPDAFGLRHRRRHRTAARGQLSHHHAGTAAAAPDRRGGSRNGQRLMTPAPGQDGMNAGNSARRVVIAAFIGNLAVALTKFVAAALTGSSAMISEGVHSLVDTTNELLLLHGMRQSSKPADADHPFGYG